MALVSDRAPARGGGAFISLRPARVAAIVGALTAMLWTAGVAGQWAKYGHGVTRSFGIIHSLDFDAEGNVAAWFSSGLLLACAALLATIAVADSGQHSPDELVERRRAPRGDWVALAALFVVLSMDEVAQLHEMTNAPLRDLLGADGALYYTWVLPGTAFVVALVALFGRFLAALPRRTRNLVIAAGCMFVGGALGLELVSGWYASRHGAANLTHALLAHAEEGMELAGCVTFLYALLDYMRLQLGLLIIRLDAPSPR